jgi:hypothetical protein
MTASEETLRSTVGRAALVPRKRTESDIPGIYLSSAASRGAAHNAANYAAAACAATISAWRAGSMFPPLNTTATGPAGL